MFGKAEIDNYLWYTPTLKGMKSGIYRIINLKNKRGYIGSAKDLIERKCNHFSMLNCNRHHSVILQRAYNKSTDKSVFEFQVIEYCKENNLLRRENYYLQKECKAKDYLSKQSKEFLKLSYNILPHAVKGFSGKHKKETIERFILNNPFRKDIRVYDMNGILIGDFLSSQQVAIKTQITKSAVLKLCKKDHISKSGYIIGFKGKDFKNYIKKLKFPVKYVPWNKGKTFPGMSHNKTRVRVTNLRTGKITEFTSQLLISKKLKMQPCRINTCLKTKRPHRRGYLFEYV